MDKRVDATQSSASFEYELLDTNPDRLRTVVASSDKKTPWIEAAKLKLRHRIGRGPFGDVWLATHHQSTEDYDEYHEVAVKMFHSIKEDNMKAVLDKLEDVFFKCQGVDGLCQLHGTSILNGKICIVMKLYDGSIGDKLAHLKGGKLALHDVLRYGTNLAMAISELHSKGFLVLNLKPCNVLLKENDQAILGDFGIPYLLLGIQLVSSDVTRRIGSPSYMAPEQWQPEVRGPISFETDSWGFGCTILELLTGTRPWCGKSVDEIHVSVVKKQEKPGIPSGLPPAIENILLGCFEYDLRNRPSIMHILHAFKSLQNVVSSDVEWTYAGNKSITEKSSSTGCTQWFLSKDDLLVGDIVRSRKPLNSSKPENMDVPEGTVVGVEHDSEQHGFVLVRVHGIHDPLRVHTSTLERITFGLAAGDTSTLERITFGLAAGDWVRLKKEDKKHSPVGILHSIDRKGNVAAGFIGLETLWKGNSSEFQMAESYRVGQFVKLKPNVLSPRFEWPRKAGGKWATGKIWWILPNGCLLVKFPGILTLGDQNSSFVADPTEVESVTFDTCPGVVNKYQHLEDFHWAVRPLLISFGLFTAMKFGICVGSKIGRLKAKKRGAVQDESSHLDGQNSGNPAWKNPVSKILFREGGNTATGLAR